ncbi:MAG: sigma-E processing peptidase SpoIIGA [Lachnospiraceae bacterium]|nr:sigma-E processing peptidase SpoIIGA [Lachnospiraceae bacterium]
MKYEVYLDTVFLIQFVMNYCVFMMTASIMKLITSRLRIILAALIGAIGSCFMFLPVGLNGYVKFILVFVLWIAASTRIAFCVRGRRQYFSMLLSIVAITFLLGGVAQWLMSVFSGNLAVGIWLTLIILIYGIFQYSLRQYRRQKSLFVPVTILTEVGEDACQKVSIVALIDTGNRLRENKTGKAVCIVEHGIMPPREQYDYEVTYYALGSTGATMKAQSIPQMMIHTKEGDIKCRDVMLAFYPGKISQSGAYHMILHKDYMKEE